MANVCIELPSRRPSGYFGQGQAARVNVTDAEFLFAAINEKGRPRPVSKHDQIATHELDAATRGAHKNGKPQHTALASPHLNASLSASSWL